MMDTVAKPAAGKLITALALALLVVSAVLVVFRIDARPRTDDAFLLADVANVAPEVSGRIVSLSVRDNQTVRRGDVLFVIDPEPYQLRLDSAKASLELAASTLARLQPLVAKGYATHEQVDEARSEEERSRAAVALAERDLRETKILAPFDGKITGLNIAAGEYAVSGHPLFTMIETSKWYAVANFRETEISRMRQGTPATVYVMSDPRRGLEGHVESVGWGVTSEDATLAAGALPKVPKTLNWVRIAQRFPVRILIDRPADDLMRIGASSVVVVRYGGR